MIKILKQKMEQELSIINNKLIRKRIKREIGMLINDNICGENEFKIIHNIQTSYRNMVEYVISFKNLNDNNYYKFIISDNYPFKPPKLKINDKHLSFYHKITNDIFRISLKKYTGIECFCCETLLCYNNWNPQFTINDIIKNINDFRNANRQVIVRLIVDIIKRKYLNSDIHIIEWLY